MQRPESCLRWRLLGVVLVLLARPALALEVAPAGAFSASGELALGKGRVKVRCLTTFSGTLHADGQFLVQGVNFAGSLACRRVQALGLPWRGRTESVTDLVIENLQVDVRSALMGGRCGPATVAATWEQASSTVVFPQVALPPDCRLEGRLPTVPRLRIGS